MGQEELIQNAESYAWQHGFEILGTLGDGTQGMVWRVRDKGKLHQRALKIHTSSMPYHTEVEVYERLRSIPKLEGFNVPVILWHDDRWRAIEMGIVEPPYILDFAQACLDLPPDFSTEVWDDTLRKWRKAYGDDWPRVQRLLRALEGLGIYYLDVHRRNIALAM